MDPAGGPGPPRPAAESTTSIAPPPPEGSELQMFPFGATQQQPSLGLQIGHAADSLALPNVTSSSFDGSAAFANNPFMASIARRPEGESGQANPAQNPNSTSAMLSQINSGAVTSQSAAIPSVQRPEPSPSQAEQQQVSRDIFGELEKALALGGSSGQNNAEESFDVLDDALGMPSQPAPSRSQPVPATAQAPSPQQPPVSLQAWQESQNSDAASQRAPQLQQSQLQSQLQQESQRRELQQRQLQQQAHLAQQHLRQQHIQRQQVQQEHLHRQQIQPQQLSQISHAQPKQQPKNAAQGIVLQQSQSHSQPGLPQAVQSQPEQARQPSQSMEQAQLSQARPVPQQRQQPTAAYIQPRGVQQAQSTVGVVPGMNQLAGVKVSYPLPGFPMVGNVAGQMLNGATLGATGPLGAVAPASLGSIQPRAGETSESRMRLKPGKRPSQRRPRSKIQQSNLQAGTIQPSDGSSQPSGQGVNIPQQVPVPQHFPPGLPPQIVQQQQLQEQSPQQPYLSPQQAVRQSAAQQAQPSRAQLMHSQQHELQNRILQQQLQMQQHKGPHVQPPIAAASGHTPPQHGVFQQPGTNLAGSVQAGPKIAIGTSQQIAAQRAAQSAKYPGALQSNNLVGKFDAAALQNLLSRSDDPKVQAVLRQQLEMIRSGGFRQASPNNGANVHPHVGMQSQGQASFQVQGTNTQAPRAGVQQFSGLTRATSAPQVGAFHQQQLLQKQHAYRQSQQQYLNHGQVQPSEQSRNAGQAFSRPTPYNQQLSQDVLNVLNPHASQSMASLPQHLQHQIRAQIQARHIQAQLQSHTHFANQRSTNVPSSAALRPQTQNVAPGLPQASVQSDARKLARNPRPLSQNVDSAQPNGTLPTNADPRTDAHQQPSFSNSQLSGVGSGYYGQQVQTHIVQQSQAGMVARRRTAVRTQGKEGSQGSQSTTSRASSARRAAENKIATERKRLAQEAEAKEIAEQKRRRLRVAPTNDYVSVLSPDYKSPFTGRVNAWQRLVAFHVLSESDNGLEDKKEWDDEIDKLIDQYLKWFGTIKRNALVLTEREVQPAHKLSPDLNITTLNNEDGLVVEQVVLEDLYESARREALLAQRKAVLAAQQTLGMASLKPSEGRVISNDPALRPSSQPGHGQNIVTGAGRQHALPPGNMYQRIVSSTGLTPNRDERSGMLQRPSVQGDVQAVSGARAVGGASHFSQQAQLAQNQGLSAIPSGQSFPPRNPVHISRGSSLPLGSNGPYTGLTTDSHQLLRSNTVLGSNTQGANARIAALGQSSSVGQIRQQHMLKQDVGENVQRDIQNQSGQLQGAAPLQRHLRNGESFQSYPQSASEAILAKMTPGNSMPVTAGRPPNFVTQASGDRQRQWAGAVLSGVVPPSVGQSSGVVTASPPQLSVTAGSLALSGKGNAYSSMALPGQPTTASAATNALPVSSNQAVGPHGMSTQQQAAGNLSAKPSANEQTGLSSVPLQTSAAVVTLGEAELDGSKDEKQTGDNEAENDARKGQFGAAVVGGKSSPMGNGTERRSMGMGSLLNSEGG